MPRVVAIACLVALAGCVAAAPTTVPVMVRTSGVASASLQVTLARGTQPPPLPECPTPCLVTLPEDTSYELALTAPGYYPATMTLSFDAVWSWKGTRGASLEVPMLPRSR